MSADSERYVPVPCPDIKYSVHIDDPVTLWNLGFRGPNLVITTVTITGRGFSHFWIQAHAQTFTDGKPDNKPAEVRSIRLWQRQEPWVYELLAHAQERLFALYLDTERLMREKKVVEFTYEEVKNANAVG